MNATYGLIIRKATIFDGSGAEGFEGDVAVRDGLIVQVEKNIAASGREEIDARGQIVTPGFVDIHTHYDGQVTWEQRLSPSSDHGVTTALMGNCGVGFAPCKPGDRDTLMRLLDGIEDIPPDVMQAGLPWQWETFPEYLDFLAGREYDVDIATQVPLSALRVYVMGQRGIQREPATQIDMKRMAMLATEAVQAGALGVSTSMALGHRTRDGQLAPSIGATEAELQTIARALGAIGRGVLQLVSDFQVVEPGWAPDFEMMKRLARISARPLSFSLVENPRTPDSWRVLLDMLSEASAEGLTMRGQVLPRPVGILFGLDLSLHPFVFNPSFEPLRELPLAEKVAALRDPALRARLLAEEPQHPNSHWVGLVKRLDDCYVFGDAPNYEPGAHDRITARAAAAGVTTREYAYDLLLEREGRGMLFMPQAGYVGGNLDSTLAMMKSPHTLIGLGDGGAHYSMVCDSSYSTFLLTHWTRDRRHGEKLPLPFAIRALTHANAEALGMNDRGLIRVGCKADLNVIDYDRLQLHAPQIVRDLPAGGRRMIQRADGYTATIVNGVATYRNGEATGALPGRLVRSSATATTRAA